MEINYEQQANEFLQKTNTTIKVEYLKYDKHFAGDKEKRHIFKVIIKRDKKQFSLKFGQSIYDGAKEPTNYEILACLTKYDVGTFEDFCGEFGYDVDNRAAEKTYKGVCKEYDNICKIWSDKEIEELQEIQ